MKLQLYGKQHNRQRKDNCTDCIHADMRAGFVDDEEQGEEDEGCQDVVLCGL